MIFKLRSKGLINFDVHDDPIEVTKNFLTEKAVKNKRSRIPLMKIKEQQQRGLVNLKNNDFSLKNASPNEAVIPPSKTHVSSLNNKNNPKKNTDLSQYKTITF